MCIGDGSSDVYSSDLLAAVRAEVFFFKQKTAYEVRIMVWNSDVCSSDLDIEGARHDAVRMDMAAMRAAGFQDVDPHRVELERLGEIEVARLGEGLDLLVEQTLEIVERRVALGQVAEARIACVALITMVAAPAPAGAILFGEQPAAFLQLCQQVGCADIGLVEIGGEERANGHDGRKAQQVRTRKGEDMAEFELIADGLRFPEATVVMDDDSVIVVEIEAKRITRCWPGGKKEVIAAPGGGPIGRAHV